MANTVKKKLPELLRRYRESCGLPQGQVAEALSVDRSTYTYYEIGKTAPSINTMMKLIKILNIPYVEFLQCVNGGELASASVSLADFEHAQQSGIKKRTTSEREKIYELSADEQQLVIDYRMLPKNQQQELLKRLGNRMKEEQ